MTYKSDKGRAVLLILYVRVHVVYLLFLLLVVDDARYPVVMRLACGREPGTSHLWKNFKSRVKGFVKVDEIFNHVCRLELEYYLWKTTTTKTFKKGCAVVISSLVNAQCE